MSYFSYDAGMLPYIRFIGKVNYKEPWQHFTRTINEYIMYIVKEGNLYIIENDKKYHLKPGDFFILEPNIEHGGYQASKCEYYYIHLKDVKLNKVNKQKQDVFEELKNKRRKALLSNYLSTEYIDDGLLFLPKHYHMSSNLQFERLKYAVELFYNKEEFYRQATSTLIHSFLLSISHKMLVEYIKDERNNNTTKIELVCEQLVNYINNNYMKNMSSNDIEDIFEINFDYINRVFNKLMGTTIFRYINQVKIDNAKHMIETSNLKFSDISYLVGIEDPLYFSKVFKRYTGMTPTEYYKYINNKQ